MTSFTSLSLYAPYLVALAGLSWFAGLWAVGRAACAGIGLRLTSPWSEVVAVLLGIQVACLVVQTLGMAGMATRPLLMLIWGLFAAMGIITLLAAAGRWRSIWSAASPMPFLPLGIVVIAAAAGLLVGVAPSTKIDEIYYHMLVPGRIVLDGALHFYRAPWVAAIWPQMAYEVSSTPLHAIGYPDAPNVVSWAMSLLLLGFAWRFARLRQTSPSLAAILVGILCVGLYPIVWYGNGGAHAMGDLAMAAAIVSFAERERLVASLGRAPFAAMTSILLVCAATSKISLLPVCVILLGMNAWFVLGAVSWPQRARLLIAFLLPWAIFYLPIAVWTWIHSGSPFGPMMAGTFGPSIYPLDRIQAALRHARDGFQPSIANFLFTMAVNYSPLVWLGVLGLVTGSDLPRATRAGLAVVFVFQCGLICFLLPHEIRFLGGIHFGLLIVSVAHASDRVKQLFATSRAALMASIFFLLPWLAAQLYYAKQFFPVATGLERTAFYQRNVAYFDDYAALDRILPRDAVILAAEWHTSAVYASRPIFFDPFDLPEGKPAVLLYAGDKRYTALVASPYKPGRLIYRNADAKAVTYRSGRAPTRAVLEVRQLEKN